MDNNKRILIVSNRLPVTVKRTDKGKFDYETSAGGLVSALLGILGRIDYQWYGYPGTYVPEDEQADVEKTLRNRHQAVPVFIDKDLADKYCHGFANSVVWPLLHDKPDRANLEDSCTKAYWEVNRIVADRLAQDVQEGDMIWIHDFHLMLLPRLLREKLNGRYSNVRIGFFLHTPFPDADFFSIIPGGRDILDALLHCDLVGFHIESYADHFRDACQRLVGAQAKNDIITYRNRRIALGAFPIGINPDSFRRNLKTVTCQDNLQRMKETFKNSTVFIGVDRLDYIKGVPQKMQAFDRFLEKYPERRGQVVLLQVVVPSRGDVGEYRRLKEEINSLVGDINGRHATTTWSPVHFLYKSVTPLELAALYSMSQALVVSSSKDGMNLVSYEYVACQDQNNGSVILSKYTGAAAKLPGCVHINPWDAEETADAMEWVLTMDEATKRRNHAAAKEFVDRNTSYHWARSFLKALDKDDDTVKLKDTYGHGMAERGLDDGMIQAQCMSIVT